MFSTVVLTFIGILVAVATFFIVSKHLGSAVFWSILLGPAIGNSVIASLSNLVSGDYEGAISALKFLPCFLAAVDQGFFSSEIHESFYIIGGLMLALWIYVLTSAVSSQFGVWGLPLLPIVLYLAGSNPPNEMGMYNLRLLIANYIPALSGIVLPYYGLLALFSLVAIFTAVSYFIWSRGYTIVVKMPENLKLR